MSQASLDAVTVRGPVAEHPGAAAVVKPHAFVLPGSRGGLCALYFAPQRGVPAKGDVLVVPPFAEEMNRCLVGRLATLHFAPTSKNAENLRAEAVTGRDGHTRRSLAEFAELFAER